MIIIGIHDHVHDHHHADDDVDDAVLLLFLLPNDDHDEHKKTASVCILKYRKVIERLISLSICIQLSVVSYLQFVSLETEREREIKSERDRARPKPPHIIEKEKKT